MEAEMGNRRRMVNRVLTLFFKKLCENVKSLFKNCEKQQFVVRPKKDNDHVPVIDSVNV